MWNELLRFPLTGYRDGFTLCQIFRPTADRERTGREAMLRTVRTILGGFCFASLLSAQGGNATLTGRVNDASGAVMPGAAISVENLNTNVVVTAVSNGEGYYAFS